MTVPALLAPLSLTIKFCTSDPCVSTLQPVWCNRDIFPHRERWLHHFEALCTLDAHSWRYVAGRCAHTICTWRNICSTWLEVGSSYLEACLGDEEGRGVRSRRDMFTGAPDLVLNLEKDSQPLSLQPLLDTYRPLGRIVLFWLCLTINRVQNSRRDPFRERTIALFWSAPQFMEENWFLPRTLLTETIPYRLIGKIEK